MSRLKKYMRCVVLACLVNAKFHSGVYWSPVTVKLRWRYLSKVSNITHLVITLMYVPYTHWWCPILSQNVLNCWCAIDFVNIVWHENLIVIKFYSLPLNHLDKMLTNFNFIDEQFCQGRQNRSSKPSNCRTKFLKLQPKITIDVV